jgi:hypothetical protein
MSWRCDVDVKRKWIVSKGQGPGSEEGWLDDGRPARVHYFIPIFFVENDPGHLLLEVFVPVC